MKLIIGFLGFIATLNSTFAGDNLVLPSEIKCHSTNQEVKVVFDVNYYRATTTAGPGVVYINGDSKPQNGGWKVSLVPQHTRVTGMTEFDFKGNNIIAGLVLNPFNELGWGYITMGEEHFSLICKFK